MKSTIKITPLKNCLHAGQAGHMDVLLQIQGPKAPGEKKSRSPLNLALVIDRSGSMGGAPIEEAKKCAIDIVKGLKKKDRIAVIAYDNQVEVVSPIASGDKRDSICAAIRRIQTRGMTDLHGGHLAGAEQVADFIAKDRLTRVILLSDGNANQGEQDPVRIESQVGALAEAGVTTSTYGLGYDFNEDLMTRMAQAGRGNAYYGETAKDLAPEFEAELGILGQTFGKDVRLKVSSPNGKARVVNDYLVAGDSTCLPNLVYEAEVWAVVRIEHGKLTKGSEHKILEIELAWNDIEGAPAQAQTLDLVLPAAGKKKFEAAFSDSIVAERVKELEAVDLQKEARTAAGKGDWNTVDTVLGKIRKMAGNNAFVGGVADSLSALAEQRNAVVFSKEAAFATRAMCSRYADIEEDVSNLVAGSSYTRRKTWQGKGDAQA